MRKSRSPASSSLLKTMTDLESLKNPTTINCDNQSSIVLEKNLVVLQRSKHIDIQFQFIRDGINNRSILLKHIETEKKVCSIATIRIWKNVHMHRNPETLKTFFSSGTKRLLTSWHEERERHNFYYADCSYFAQSQPLVGLASPRVKSQLTSFSKSPKISAHRFWAWHHSYPSPVSYLGFLVWHLWLSYHLRASVNTCT